jgi:hypothetical protein
MIVTDAPGHRLFQGEMFETLSTLLRNPNRKGKGLQSFIWWFNGK